MNTLAQIPAAPAFLVLFRPAGANPDDLGALRFYRAAHSKVHGDKLCPVLKRQYPAFDFLVAPNGVGDSIQPDLSQAAENAAQADQIPQSPDGRFKVGDTLVDSLSATRVVVKQITEKGFHGETTAGEACFCPWESAQYYEVVAKPPRLAPTLPKPEPVQPEPAGPAKKPHGSVSAKTARTPKPPEKKPTAPKRGKKSAK